MLKHNDPVRNFLESYREARFSELRAKRKLLQLEAEVTATTKALSGTPGGSTTDAHRDGKLIAYADQQEKYLLTKRNASLTQQSVELFIGCLPNPDERMILRLRYVELMRWNEVVDFMSEAGSPYSERQVYRIHGFALRSARTLWRKLTDDTDQTKGE